MGNKHFKSIQTFCWQGKVFKKGSVYEAEYTGDNYYTLHAENGDLLLGSHVIDRVMSFWKNHLVEVPSVENRRFSDEQKTMEKETGKVSAIVVQTLADLETYYGAKEI
ncbi:hypothetical protein [Listeria booriae]|uniref:Uncharacterized protein n=1 Tax=Listeria booriae TaxID=1552123 RepID=A0A7X0WGM0_9LIST|nr:hypothetical protein [Listeria booriae]MBC1228800.1 hypothetical protein [Listeria booriae]MBC1318451.1 hypothetical protein [Listeria booriae]MBC1333470.1 hypothetical protein [Listeria booriae]MBC2373636.1 hypothetical protein [Listeria booriae]MBC2388775.1 hypothetical protein [Listeria booriae]